MQRDHTSTVPVVFTTCCHDCASATKEKHGMREEASQIDLLHINRKEFHIGLVLNMKYDEMAIAF